MSRWRVLGPGIAALLGVVALVVRLRMLHAPPYGDEGLHYWTARYLGGHWHAITDIYGHPAGGPEHLWLQRPLFYLLMWIPSQAGFLGFRAAATVLGALLAPAAYATARAHGVSRLASALAGGAVALLPPLVVWTHLGLMDGAMTLFLLGVFWARAMGRPVLALASGVAAAWTKETALVALGLLAAWQVAQGLRAGKARLVPLHLDAMTSALAWALVLGALPVVAFMFLDVWRVGAIGQLQVAGFADRVFATPYLAGVLLVGIAHPRSRLLCVSAFVGAGALLAMQWAGRDVAGWYDVPVLVLALLGAAACGDAFARSGRDALAGGRWAQATTRLLPALAAVLLAGLVAFLPPGPGRDRLHPLTDDGGHDLPALWRWENRLRDADLVHAWQAMPLEVAPVVLAVDIYPGHLYVPFVEQAGAVHLDWSWARSSFPFDVASLAAAIEGNATWTIVHLTSDPMNAAIRATYADCVRWQEGRYVVLEGAPCGGRAERLEQAWRDLDPRF